MRQALPLRAQHSAMAGPVETHSDPSGGPAIKGVGRPSRRADRRIYGVHECCGQHSVPLTPRRRALPIARGSGARPSYREEAAGTGRGCWRRTRGRSGSCPPRPCERSTPRCCWGPWKSTRPPAAGAGPCWRAAGGFGLSGLSHTPVLRRPEWSRAAGGGGSGGSGGGGGSLRRTQTSAVPALLLAGCQRTWPPPCRSRPAAGAAPLLRPRGGLVRGEWPWRLWLACPAAAGDWRSASQLGRGTGPAIAPVRPGSGSTTRRLDGPSTRASRRQSASVPHPTVTATARTLQHARGLSFVTATGPQSPRLEGLQKQGCRSPPVPTACSSPGLPRCIHGCHKRVPPASNNSQCHHKSASHVW